MKKIVLLVFVLLLLSLVVVDSNIETCAGDSGDSGMSNVPWWVRVGTYAEYSFIDLKHANETPYWKWEIVSVANQIEVLHTFNPKALPEGYPSVYKSTINPTTRGIINVTSIDKELSPDDSPPFPTYWTLWVPADLKINDTVFVYGPYPPWLPELLPVLRFENVDTPLETKECAVIGVEIGQVYGNITCQETHLFYYNLNTNVLVKYYVNNPTYNIEGMFILKQWVPVWEFNFTFGEETYNITASSNSTVTDFYINPDEGAFIKFNVTGPTGTNGFCNISIPDDLLWGEFSIYKDGSLLVRDADYTQTYNGTHYIFYITYTHTTHVIEIRGTEVVPEFTTWTSMLLILLMLTVAIVIYKRRLHKISFH